MCSRLGTDFEQKCSRKQQREQNVSPARSLSTVVRILTAFTDECG